MQSFKKTTLNYLKTFTIIFALFLILSCSQTVGTDGGGSGGGSGNSTNQTNTEQKTDNQNTNNNSKTDNTENKNNSGTNSGKIQYHTITFEINGGSWESGSAPESKIYNNTSLNWSKYKLVREGYVFLGWFRTSDFSGSRIENITETDPETMTVYARFVEDKPYKITYELNGGYWPENANYHDSYKPSDSDYYRYFYDIDPVRENYYFEGFFETPDFSGNRIYAVPFSAVGEQTYYAKWNSLPTITYNLNGGEWVGNTEYIPYNYMPKSIFYVHLPSKNQIQKEGYYFDGWYDNPDFTGYERTSIDPYEAHFENLIFYAKWNKKPSITFKLNGGEWKEDAQIIKDYDPKGSSFPLPGEKQLNKKKFHFTGWYETEDFSGKCYKGSYYPKNSTDDKTFYAKWEECPKIEYELNGGEWTVDIDSLQLYYEIKDEYWDEETIYLPSSSSLKRDGYYFYAWYDNPEFTGGNVEYISHVKENQKFYACWKEKPTIEYVLNGGEWISSIKTVYENGEKVGDLPNGNDLQREGYHFSGWYKTPDFSDKKTTYISYIHDSVTLYAKWAKIYYITYELNGGEWADDDTLQGHLRWNSEMYYESQYITLPYISTSTDSSSDGYNKTIIKRGYDWGEIYYETPDFSDNGIKVGDYNYTYLYYKDFSDDKTFYIKWTPIKYRIFYNNSGYDFEWINEPKDYYTIEDEIILPTASDMRCDGSTFHGWYDYSGNLVTSIPKGSTNNRGFYAHWSKDTTNTITLESFEDEDNINLSLSKNSTCYTITADKKYKTYLWKIDGLELPNTGYIIEISNNDYEAGYHNITLVVTDQKGRTYSASSILTIQK